LLDVARVILPQSGVTTINSVTLERLPSFNIEPRPNIYYIPYTSPNMDHTDKRKASFYDLSQEILESIAIFTFLITYISVRFAVGHGLCSAVRLLCPF
jgi:hypothetical protein